MIEERLSPNITRHWDEGREGILNDTPVPPRAAQRDLEPPRRVRARLVWERSGPQVVETWATAWTRGRVLVTVLDPRSRTRGAWLSIRDAEPIDTPDTGAPPAQG